jgi:LPS-assembly protein
LCVICSWPALLAAQSTGEKQATTPPAGTVGSSDPLLGTFSRNASWKFEQVSANHFRLTGQVELEGDQLKFFADEIEIFTDTHRLVASGNVVFANPEGRIAAERVEFDTEHNVGTFHQASGLMSLGEHADKTQFGGQDPDVYFYGEILEKLSDRQYRLTRGGFTTCVQPTPRWEVTSGKVTINLNDYAIARGTVLRVKGVPLMYMPVIYYPLQEDQRATGFLIPTYGTSTLRGQSLSNAFFWAIDRSQDATFFHDWFTRTGQGAGAEYRYVAGQQSYGNLRLYRFAQREVSFAAQGSTNLLPQNDSYDLTGTAIQALGGPFRGRLRMEYFSDIGTQQLYHQNLYQATRRSRVIEGSVSGNLGPLATTALYQRNEVFNGVSNGKQESVIYGSTPRVSAILAPQRLFDLPFYGSLNSEFASLPYRYLTGDVATRDDGLSRFDLSPTLRVPLSRLTFLSLNTSAAYRTTHYSRSFDARGRVVSQSLFRQYLSVRSDVVGPVFTRIWDLEGGFAERLKHVVEPTFTMDYTTGINNYKRTPVLSDLSDFVVGGATRFTYGLNNRFFYRGRPVDGVRGQTREFVTVGVQQTYYSNSESSQYDTTYASAYRGRKLVDLSPVSLNVRVSPTTVLDANSRVEYDVSGGGLQIFTAGSNVNFAVGSANVSYSRRHLTKTSPVDSYLSSSTTLRFRNGRATGTYGLSWDVGRSTIVSQNVIGSYLAQCCGLQLEFQKFNYPQFGSFPIPADRRFNLSFVLAGLGTFSNFFGAFGGQR